MTVKEAYNYCEKVLTDNAQEEAAFKALCLVCHLAGIPNSAFALHQDKTVDDLQLKEALHRLLDGEPLQYVLGSWDFYESTFFVGEGVLIPRPETEELVALAVNACRDYDAPVVYDLCAGSGCIGISVAKKIKNARVYCIEKSREAFAYLQKNAQGVSNVTIINGDINEPFDLPRADVLLSNPPYIKQSELPLLQQEVQREPKMALDGGEDGLDFYRLIAAQWRQSLKHGGVMLLEIGNEQGEAVSELLQPYFSVEVIKDIYGNDRIVRAVYQER